jgi:GTPase KRas
MSEDAVHKVVVLGAGGVGKSALTIRLVTDHFLEEYHPTIEDNFQKSATIDNIPTVIDILDTAGQDEYSSMQDQWMREGNGFVLVYAVDEAASFEDVSKYREKIFRTKNSKSVPM